MRSAWTVPPAAAHSFFGEDGKTGLIVAAISGGETNAQNNAKRLSDELVHDRDGVTVRVRWRGHRHLAGERADPARPVG